MGICYKKKDEYLNIIINREQNDSDRGNVFFLYFGSSCRLRKEIDVTLMPKMERKERKMCNYATELSKEKT